MVGSDSMSFARFIGGGGGSSDSFSRFLEEDETEKIQNQINNATTRIADAGYSVEDTDKRNWFEKLTNLPKGQNFFLDTLELLGRPGQAVKNVLDKTGGKVQTQNVAEAAWRGFSGKDKVQGTDLAEKLGIENKAGKFIAGVGIDIATDPLTYVPGGVLAKGAKATGSLAAIPVKAGYKTLEETLPLVKNVRETKIEPLFNGLKNAAGKAFIYQHKWDETLNGTKDDLLKNLYNQTHNDINFSQEESLKKIANLAKTAGGLDTGVDVGRIMEKDLQVMGPRPYREMSDSPMINMAAKQLIDSNKKIREWAASQGIDVPELEGYMKHVWSQAERDLRKVKKPVSVDSGNFGLGNPNKKILNLRKLQGSAEDINDELGREFFNPNAYFSTAIGQRQLIGYVGAKKFKDEVLSNTNFAVPYEKGMVIPKNAVVISPDKYKFFKMEVDDGREIVAVGKGKEYVVTKGVKEALDRFDHLTTDEGISEFFKIVDNVQGFWKRLTLFSPGYHIRNIAGGLFNNYVGGMRPDELVRYTATASKEVMNAMKGAESQLFTEFRQQGLGASAMSRVEFNMHQEPEKAIEQLVKDKTKTLPQKIKHRVNPLQWTNTSREAGEVLDQTNRFALYSWARAKGMSPEEAAAKVREVQFDYTRNTNAEREVFARLAPFYRWMRNNIPFQLKSLINDPSKYNNVNKIRENAQDAAGLEDENTPQFMKENFAIPVNENKFLSLNLPLADIAKVGSPMKTLTDALSPLIKTPVEYGANFNLFKKKPIEQFEGQEKQYRVPLIGAEFGLPIKDAYVAEQALGQIGRGLSGYLQKPDSEDQDDKFRVPTMGVNSIFKDFDPEKSAYLEKLDKLKRLQDFIKWIEQQEGVKPRTINEIKKGQ